MGHTETSDRKKDHIEMAFESVVANQDNRFYYEPLFSAHPKGDLEKVFFAGNLVLKKIINFQLRL